MSSTNFDIAIIGAGAAGLHLALAMQSDAFFSNHRILILEKDRKDSNDRTWSFWEKGAGKWDALIEHSWEMGDFFSAQQKRSFRLHPYQYKTLRSLKFYDFAKKRLASAPNFTWQQDEIVSVETRDRLHLTGKAGQYQAGQVFDSRIPPAFFDKNDSYTRLLQHFRGWFIRTPDDRFDPGRFTMMDYRLTWNDTTSFTYLLPFNEREAIVEFTLFTSSLLQEADYDQMLRRYCREILELDHYDILETEQGVIPMSDFPFHRYSTDRHLKIGTAGGWVKPSSGYSFKNCEKNAQLILENLKRGRPAGQGLLRSRFRFYDTLFLDVLNRRNELGPDLFSNMYFKNDIQKILAFLDEESGIVDDLLMLPKFPNRLFLQAIFHQFTR